MGEFLQRDVNDPHYVPDSKGASGDTGKYLQAVALAQSSGRSVEECLAFLGVNKPATVATQLVPVSNKPEGELPEVLKDKVVPLPVEESLVTDEEAKELAPVKPVKEVPADGFVVTEEYDEADAPEDLINKVTEQEVVQDWSGTIREGSKVKVTWHRDEGVRGRLQWVGKIGKVIRKIGNENATIYEVEFAAGKIPQVRRNPKTGKLQKGFRMKKLSGLFDATEIALAE